MRFLTSLMLLTAGALMLPGLSYTTPISSSMSLAAAGLTFDEFTCTVTGQGSAFPTSCGSIDIHTINSPASGIQVSSGFTSFPFSFSDVLLDYHLSSAAGIDVVGLSYNGTFSGYAISSVTETVKNAAGVNVGFAKVACDQGFLGGCQHSDNIALSGSYHDLYIEKDISVTSFLGEAQISYIDQTFALAPEPSSIALVGSSFIGAAVFLRRRSKANATKHTRAS